RRFRCRGTRSVDLLPALLLALCEAQIRRGLAHTELPSGTRDATRAVARFAVVAADNQHLPVTGSARVRHRPVPSTTSCRNPAAFGEAKALRGAMGGVTAVVPAFHRPARTRSAARSAMAKTAACELPATVVGMTEASTTRSPETPITRSHGST